jgi:acetyltransferase
VFNDMWRYSSALESLYETPSYPKQAEEVDAKAAVAIIERARAAGRELLTEVESKEVLAAYGIPVVPTRLAATADAAVELAAAIGYPVALKLHSQTITHKSDAGGVRLNLADEPAVRAAYAAIASAVGEAFQGVSVQPMTQGRGYELILGSGVDPHFGPIILFGWGGEMVEVMQDRALTLPPLNNTLAMRLIERTRIFRALPGVRGRKAVDVKALAGIVVRFSRLVVEQPWIAEIHINPLLASSEEIVALDARIVLHSTQLNESELPHIVIRPYPASYVTQWTMKNGSPVVVRPIRPEDEPMMVRFHLTLSDDSVYFRYFQLIQLDQRVKHQRLARQCFIDYDREIALVAELKNPAAAEIIGVARMTRARDANEAEIAVIVSDSCHNLGLGTQLVRCLIDVARREGLERLLAVMLPENLSMHHVFEKLGFSVNYSRSDHLVHAHLQL